MKVVYNACYGGFGLSAAAVDLGRQISGDPDWGENDWDISRYGATLVAVVEQLGIKADGSCAELSIIDVPRGSLFVIDEYDGRESIMLQSDYDWIVAI